MHDARSDARPARKALVALALFVLAVLAAKGLGEGYYYANLYSQDFQWSPAVLLREGHDPYAWYLAGNLGERIIMSQQPSYLQLLYVLLQPFAHLSWPAAKAAWGLCNAGFGLAAGFLLARAAGLRGVSFAAALLVYIAATPFAHVVGNGQQSFVALLFLTLAWLNRDSGAGGLAYAVGATKYSFAPPLTVWWLLERRFAPLAVGALALFGGALVFAALCRQSPLSVAFEPVKVSAAATHVALGDVMSLCRSLGLDASIGSAPVYLLALAVAALAVALLWSRRRRLDDLTVFALLCQAPLFCFFHHLYDYVMLAPLFFRAVSFQGALRIATFVYIGYFWFVVKLLDPYQILQASAPIAAMALGSAAMFATVALAAPPRRDSYPRERRPRALSSPATNVRAL